MTVAYRSFADPSEATGLIANLTARTVILDVEPLIAYWDTDQQVLSEGVTAILARLDTACGLYLGDPTAWLTNPSTN